MFWRCKQADPKFSLGMLEKETGIKKTNLDKMMKRAAASTFDPKVVARLFSPLCKRGIRPCEVAALMGERLSSISVGALPEAVAPLPVVDYATAVRFAGVVEQGRLGLTSEHEDRFAVHAAFESCGGIMGWQHVAGMPATCWEVAMWDMSFRHALPGQRLVVDHAQRTLVDGWIYVLAFGPVLQVGRYSEGRLVPMPHDGHGGADFEIPLWASGYTVMGRVRRVVGQDL